MPALRRGLDNLIPNFPIRDVCDCIQKGACCPAGVLWTSTGGALIPRHSTPCFAVPANPGGWVDALNYVSGKLKGGPFGTRFGGENPQGPHPRRHSLAAHQCFVCLLAIAFRTREGRCKSRDRGVKRHFGVGAGGQRKLSVGGPGRGTIVDELPHMG